MSQYGVFLYDGAVRINQARQEHLAGLGIDLQGRRVLEVGAGIGLHTPFFLERGCDVLITDGAAANVEEIQRRHPGQRSQVLDIETADSLRHLGDFDVVYCYGLLYHIGNPESALAMMAEISDMILLELICNRDTGVSLDLVQDPPGLNQSTQRNACRPSRAWIMDQLRRHWGHAYITSTQPDHPEFPADWDHPTHANTRAVFVGSRRALSNDLLREQVPQQQTIYKKGQ